MNEKIIVPALGESITEATVSKWIKNQGDQVKEDEPIVELETDKVNVEVPSPAEGVISKINFKTGDTVEVGALLGTISSQGGKVISSEKVVSITKSKEQKKKQDAIKEEKDKDGNDIIIPQGIDQAKLVPLLTASLQEAITKIETLEAKVAVLEG